MLPSITTGLQKTNDGKGRPLEYIMLPLSELAEILGQDLTAHRIFRAVEEHLTHEIEAIFEDCDQLRTFIHTMYTSMQKVEDFFQDEEMNQIIVHEQISVRTLRNIRNRIGKMLVRVRSGNAESSEFDQLLVELESQVATLKTQTKQFERGDINEKLKYALELKEKNVIPVRETESLAIIQNRHPKHQVVVLYTSNELRTSSKDKWVTVYFEFLGRIEANLTPVSRLLFCYFDYDLHPNFQPQYKKLEVREYVGTPIIIPTARIRPETIDRQASVNGIDSLVRTNLIINQKKYIYISLILVQKCWCCCCSICFPMASRCKSTS
jgi:prefoldin subunit 5